MSLLKITVLLIGILILTASSTNAQVNCDEIEVSQDYLLHVVSNSGLPGDTIWVPVYLETTDPGLMFFFYINYDHDYLTPVPIPGYPEYVISEQTGRFIDAPGFVIQQSPNPLDSGCLIAIFDPITSPYEIPPGEGIIFRMAFTIDNFFPYGDSAKFWFQESQNTYTCQKSAIAVSDPQEPSGIGTNYPVTPDSYIYYDTSFQDLPIIYDFHSQPRSIVAGDTAWVSWNVSVFSDSAKINNGFGPLYMPWGTEPVMPTATITYDLSVYNAFGYSQKSITINVTQPGENQYPVISYIEDHQVVEGNTLTFAVSASDPDGGYPNLSTSPLPGTATFTDSGNGTGSISWLTNESDIGDYTIILYAIDASDPSMIDSLYSEITVLDMNYPPQWDFDFSVYDTLYENDTLQFMIEAWDPDSTIPFITGHIAGEDTLATNMVFIDSGNGKGSLTFTPDSYQGNYDPYIFYVRFTIYDSENPSISVQTPSKRIYVFNENSGLETPTLTFPDGEGPFDIIGGNTLEFELYASNTNGDIPDITSTDLPENASLIDLPDSINGSHKLFIYTPLPDIDSTFEITFFATNEGMVDSTTIIINVTKANSIPILFLNPYQQDEIIEGETLYTVLEAFDADGVYPILDAFLDSRDTLATNMHFTDSGNGIGVLTFNPNQVQGNSPNPEFYYVRFSAQDPDYPEVTIISYTWAIKVFDSGLPCCIDTKGDVDYSGNGNSGSNVADIVHLVNYVIKDQGVIPCFGEADIDNSGTLNMSDIIILVDYLFRNGSIPNCL